MFHKGQLVESVLEPTSVFRVERSTHTNEAYAERPDGILGGVIVRIQPVSVDIVIEAGRTTILPNWRKK